LRKHLNEVPQNVLEIGAGTGYFPYLFSQKYPNVKYNIVDLPVISVIQSYIYATMVGEDKIWFHGEDKTDAQLRIFAPGTINDIEGKIDVVLNLNSFPEIPSGAQSAYLNRMRELLTDKGFFYSVNWEPQGLDQTPVKIACSNNGFKNTYRRIFPVESEVHPSTSIEFFEEIYTP
jgi:putative sugar O-methyltransferase